MSLNPGSEAVEERVLRTIPKERLLIFNLSDGWRPLADFLGQPVPDAPFPHVDRFEDARSTYHSHPGDHVSLAQRTAVRLRRQEL